MTRFEATRRPAAILFQTHTRQALTLFLYPDFLFSFSFVWLPHWSWSKWSNYYVRRGVVLAGSCFLGHTFRYIFLVLVYLFWNRGALEERLASVPQSGQLKIQDVQLRRHKVESVLMVSLLAFSFRDWRRARIFRHLTDFTSECWRKKKRKNRQVSSFHIFLKEFPYLDVSGIYKRCTVYIRLGFFFSLTRDHEV